MKVQIRSLDGGTKNVEIITLVDFIRLLEDSTTNKVSFDLEGGRIALYTDGTYQIYGGIVNYPHF